MLGASGNKSIFPHPNLVTLEFYPWSYCLRTPTTLLRKRRLRITVQGQLRQKVSKTPYQSISQAWWHMFVTPAKQEE
jgi:hypothetical protein